MCLRTWGRARACTATREEGRVAKHTATAFSDETIVIDGQSFLDCEFRGVTLIYEGGVVPEFRGCTLADCTWRFEAAADRSLQVLRIMRKIGPDDLRADIDRLTGRSG